MKRYKITVEDNVFDVKVLSDPRLEEVIVEVEGETFTVEVEAVSPAAEATAAEEISPPAPSPRRSSPISTDPSSTVVAPLPGLVKSVAVRPGQKVAANDELLIIEAMKMDNVIRATRAGTIEKVRVREGNQVAHGEPMLDYTD